MFSLLNMINSISGKYMSSGVLILITVIIYCFVINQMIDEIYENNVYLTMLIILLITDIASITYLFVNFSREDTNLPIDECENNIKPIKKDVKNKNTTIKDTTIKDTKNKNTTIKNTKNKNSEIKDTKNKNTTIKDTKSKNTEIKDTKSKNITNQDANNNETEKQNDLNNNIVSTFIENEDYSINTFKE